VKKISSAFKIEGLLEAGFFDYRLAHPNPNSFKRQTFSARVGG